MRPITRCLPVLLLALAACDDSNKSSVTKQNDLGTGLNTVTRQYSRSTADTWAAAEAALQSQDLKIESDRHDAMGGDLQARRANGEKVEIRVRSLDLHSSDVSIRVEPGNRNMAALLHDKLAEKLGLREETRATVFGGNTAEGTYPYPTIACVKAVEEASKRLDLTVTNRDANDDVAIVDAHESSLNPAQFQIKKADSGTKVTFIAGREKSDANQDLARRMKAEFENACTAKSN